MINCVSSVKKELRNTVGIASIEVDFDPEQEIDHATITFDNKQIDSTKIKTIIEGINGGQYVVTEMKSANVAAADEDVLSKEASSAVSNTSSFSIIDQVQNIARTDFEIPNIFQILNAIF
jgi:copper chaperone CopZ